MGEGQEVVEENGGSAVFEGGDEARGDTDMAAAAAATAAAAAGAAGVGSSVGR